MIVGWLSVVIADELMAKMQGGGSVVGDDSGVVDSGEEWQV